MQILPEFLIAPVGPKLNPEQQMYTHSGYTNVHTNIRKLLPVTLFKSNLEKKSKSNQKNLRAEEEQPLILAVKRFQLDFYGQ